MANIRKSFNFKSGVQVDDDNFIVNSNGLVGIGTSIPGELLEVYGGNVKITGLVTATSIYTPTLNVGNKASIQQLNIGITSITSGIITAISGVVTYYGDGGRLLNLPTSQWLDIDVGLGFTSIYNKGFVGVSTNDPRFSLQIGGNVTLLQNGVGINSNGNIEASGIITAKSFSGGNFIGTSFVGGNFIGTGSGLINLNASNISSGTLNNSRLPSNINVSGIITAQTGFVGNITGFASTAYNVDSNAKLTIISVDSSYSSSSISTITNNLYVSNKIGVGTFSAQGDIEIKKSSGISSIQLISENSESKLIIGRVSGDGNSNTVLKYGNTTGTYNYNTPTSFDIINYGSGFINNYISQNTGFNWVNLQSPSSPKMSLTYDGNLGIGITNPLNTLHVVGTSTVTTDSFVGNNLKVGNNFIVGENPNTLLPGVLASSNGDIKASGNIECNNLTVSNLFGNGSNLTNLKPENIGFGTISGNIDVNTTGIITSNGFSGNGSNITAIKPENIDSGTIDSFLNINTVGIITSNGFSNEDGKIINFTLVGTELTLTVTGVGYTRFNLIP